MSKIFEALRKHGPELATGLGIAGMITGTILAIKATPKAIKLVEEKKVENEELEREVTTKEVIKTTWKCYIPAVTITLVSATCIVLASVKRLKMNAALAAAYSISETTLQAYKRKTLETVGEKKEQAIREAVAKEKMEQNPVSRNQILPVAKGETLCYDSASGRYFKHDIEKIRKVVNELNRRMRDEMYISLNEFYTELGLDRIKLGEDLGWTIDWGYIDITFGYGPAENEEPCLILDYTVEPRYGYRNLH